MEAPYFILDIARYFVEARNAPIAGPRNRSKEIEPNEFCWLKIRGSAPRSDLAAAYKIVINIRQVRVLVARVVSLHLERRRGSILGALPLSSGGASYMKLPHPVDQGCPLHPKPLGCPVPTADYPVACF